jgi:hypothetical protein
MMIAKSALALAAAAMLSLGLTGPAAADGHEKGRFDGWGVRAGAFAQDTGIFSSSKEEGVAINVEILAPSPDFLDFLWSPRPMIGGNIATDTDATSFGYAGLRWDKPVWDRVYITGALGGSVNDADILTEDDLAPGANPQDQRFLGCNVLFYLGIGVGYSITDAVNVELYADHISNANICDSNEGLENAGIRLGYEF